MSDYNQAVEGFLQTAVPGRGVEQRFARYEKVLRELMSDYNQELHHHEHHETIEALLDYRERAEEGLRELRGERDDAIKALTGLRERLARHEKLIRALEAIAAFDPLATDPSYPTRSQRIARQALTNSEEE